MSCRHVVLPVLSRIQFIRRFAVLPWQDLTAACLFLTSLPTWETDRVRGWQGKAESSLIPQFSSCIEGQKVIAAFIGPMQLIAGL
jgi:hypothetical protein